MRTPLKHAGSRSTDGGGSGSTPAVDGSGGASTIASSGRVPTGGTAGTTHVGGAGGTTPTGGNRGTGGIATSAVIASGGHAGGGTRITAAPASGGNAGTGGTRGSGGIGGGATGGTAGAHGSGGIGSGGTSLVGGTRGSGGIGSGGTNATTRRGGSGGMPTGGISGAGGSRSNPYVCGDGKVDPGEECDLGSANDASAAFWVSQGGLKFAAIPLVGTGSAADFYAYKSNSAHTGYEAVGTSRMMLYLDRSTLVLSLVFFHGIDQDSTGLQQPRAHVQMQFSGLPDGTTVEVADDSGDELFMPTSTTATGFWVFENNSDGGVLCDLPLPGVWSVKVAPSFNDGITVWTWLQPDGSLVNLDLAEPLTIDSRSKHGQCRPDCTQPQCGDGILDGGEVCDDGRPSRIGCSTNCASFN